MQYYSSSYSRILPSTSADGDTMSRIHPSTTPDAPRDPSPSPSVMLTVWKRSSMSFQGTDGFTVFDRHGRLAFRVDNYTRKSSRYVLMDGSGHPLLTLKPQVPTTTATHLFNSFVTLKFDFPHNYISLTSHNVNEQIFSMQNQWNGYRGEDQSVKSPKSRVFAMRRPSVLIHRSACEAEVYMETSCPPSETPPPVPDFRIEGSFRRRNCKIKNSGGQVAAKILRKRAANTTVLLSDDVFSLLVEPGFDPELMMAFVIILDRICGKPFAPVLCS
ncbi:hypothetical protein LguiA_016534 [Lonicera macranthoides]